MTASDERSPGPRDAASVLADFLRRLEDGEDADIEALCAEHPDLADDLREAYRVWSDIQGDVRAAGWTLRSPELDSTDLDESPSDTWSEVLQRLAAHAPSDDRYRIRGEISKGGMGVVTEVWDCDLRRHIAMKRMLALAPGEGDASARDQALGRFLDEAQITAQLSHPGIVPVHELGVNGCGQLYFTMKRVRGEDLSAIFAKVRAGEQGWNQARALGVLMRVCEAMAFAHSKRVIHRDLKPANIMVGRFGEVHVMDWGLARVMGRDEPSRKPDEEHPSVRSVIWRDRADVADGRPDSPIVTEQGDVVGTPSYMAPEQAQGELARIGPHSDAYSMGAILYELLTGHPPYVTPGVRMSNREVWQRVLAGPPTPVEQLAPRADPELVSITERAMFRDIEHRYPDMRAVADDVRAYLENRVVKAHASGAFAELRKWVRRNKGIATAAAVAVLVAIGAAFAVANAERLRASEARFLLDVSMSGDLVDEAGDLGPIDPTHRAQREQWTTRAGELTARGTAYLEQLAELRERRGIYREGQQREDRATHPLAIELEHCEALIGEFAPRLEESREALAADAEATAADRRRLRWKAATLEWHRERAARLRAEVERERGWVFPTTIEQERHDAFAEYAENHRALVAPDHGAMARVGREIAWIDSLLDRMSGEWQSTWKRARDAIRQHPEYGFDLAPQFSLFPLGPDPESGLWEFWHVLSGDAPERDRDGAWIIGPETGIVLVLLPGDREFHLGSDPEPGQPNHDEGSRESERPVRTVSLDPFFISKYEMTQGQWIRATGTNDAFFYVGAHYRGVGTILGHHPVENVTWNDCQRAVTRYALALPTEAQWEYAARGENEGSFWWSGVEGFDARSINVVGGYGPMIHRPVGSGPANPFGLHHIIGNVWEYCRDWYAEDYEGRAIEPGTGLLAARVRWTRVTRGGAFNVRSANARSARRISVEPDRTRSSFGVRPSRPVRD